MCPHDLGSGLKLAEMLDSHVGSALIILTAAMREPRGGGDFDWGANWHGPERTGGPEGPVNEEYDKIARRTIGRWAGDEIAIVGDYAHNDDLDAKHIASAIFAKCGGKAGDTLGPFKKDETTGAYVGTGGVLTEADLFNDVTADVAAVIEHELRGKFTGEGWREFQRA